MESKYFAHKELECKCGCGKADMDDMFLERLDMLRYKYNRPIILNSAYRCSNHNENVGGVANSSHTKGLAVDIKCSGSEKYWLLKHAMGLGFQGIGVASSFLHLDDKTESPRPNVWTY